MKHFFEHSNSSWVRYSRYELKDDENKIAYITPAKDAVPELYDPLKNTEDIVLDAVKIGKMSIGKQTKVDIEMAVLDFVNKYGLLGIMTAIPTTADFMNYDTVYLTKNQLIEQESMPALEYMDYFFPFQKPNIGKGENGMAWSVGDDVSTMAIAMTMSDRPLAMNLEFQRLYAERIDWIVRLFKDWAFIFITCFLYYNDKEHMTDMQKQTYQKSLSLFDGVAPTYHIALLDKPTLVWDFNSLATLIRTMFYFAMTDEKNPLHLCKHCQKPFIASRPSAVFCSPQCKNRYNVYKSRRKKE